MEHNYTIVEKDVFHCTCATPEHNFMISTYKDNGIIEEVVIEVHMDNWKPFFKRVWTAIRYIFKKIPYGCYDTVLLEKPGVEKMIKVLRESLKEM